MEAPATGVPEWTVWTLENWDLEEFTDVFIDKTRENVEGAGQSWTDQMRDALRAAAPNRFNDILAVLLEADNLTALETAATAAAPAARDLRLA